MDEKTQKNMGELAAMIYNDKDFVVPEGMSVHDAMNRWVEERYPGTQAKLHTAAAVAQAKQEIAAEREKDKQERLREKAKETREKELERLKANPEIRLKDDEIEKLEKFAVDRGIGNWEDAAYRFRQIHTVAAPAPSGRTGGVEIPGREGSGSQFDWMKPAFGQDGIVNHANLERVTKRHVNEILDDFKRDPAGAVQRWGA